MKENLRFLEPNASWNLSVSQVHLQRNNALLANCNTVWYSVQVFMNYVKCAIIR